MEQVARVLISNASTNRSEARRETEGGEEFGDVTCAFGENYSRGVLGLGSDEQMVVFLERGAAAGGVGDDGIEIVCREGREVLASEVAGDIPESGVDREGTATELSSRDDDFTAICGEDADGCFVEGSEHDVGYAAGEEGYAGTAFALGGVAFAQVLEKKVAINCRKNLLALGKTQDFQNSKKTRYGLQAGALVEAQELCDHGDATRIWKQAPIDEIACETRKERALVFVFDAFACVFNQPSVPDSGGAGGFASAAVEAFINMVDEWFADGEFALLDKKHLANAASGRIGFEMPQPVGGAMVETESAMDTEGKILKDRYLARSDGLRRHVQIPPANRPGAKIACGSKACFSRCMRGKSGRVGPHTLRWSFSQAGA